MRLHDLRHFAATQLLAAGVPVRTVSGRLGHANPATTLNVYAAWLQKSDQAAAAVLSDLLAKTEEVSRTARSMQPPCGGRKTRESDKSEVEARGHR